MILRGNLRKVKCSIAQIKDLFNPINIELIYHGWAEDKEGNTVFANSGIVVKDYSLATVYFYAKVDGNLEKVKPVPNYDKKPGHFLIRFDTYSEIATK
jgi:hypothetical protein